MPQVIFVVQDGRLGILPPIGDGPVFVCGTCSAGTVNVPQEFTRPKDIVDVNGYGDAITLASAFAGRGYRVMFVKTGGSAAAVNGSVDSTGKTGTSVMTFTGSSAVTCELVVEFLTGGTVGTAGISYRVSRDGGRNFDAPKTLGTANTITIEKSGLVVALAAGTVVAGDVIKGFPTAAQPNDAELLAALNAAHASTIKWDLAVPEVNASAANFDIVSTFCDTATNQGRPCSAIMRCRMPNVGESEAAYKAALDAIFTGQKQSTYIELTAGDCRISSQVDGGNYRAPFGWEHAVLTFSLQPHQVASAPAYGGVPVSIRDSLGNVTSHDERVNPGLSSGNSRFSVASTYLEVSGVIPWRAQLFSAAGSDFDLHAHRRVLNRALSTIYVPMVRRIHIPVPVDAKTGKILETEAVEIERAIQTLLEDTLYGAPMVSSVLFTLSRSDNLLSTKTLTADLAITPLGYPDAIRVNVGFRNPALQTRLAA
jgi:hypothetical protein